jgi:transposase-like protein
MSTAQTNTKPKAIDWEALPVHPAAEKLPLMSDSELDELAQDIATNGLQQPIVLWRDNQEEPNGAEGPFPLYLLDGRNRLAALKRLGITDPYRAKTGQGGYEEKVRILKATSDGLLIGAGRRGKTTVAWKTDTNPITLVLSMNVRRRHLTSEQKREAIAAYIDADPKASNRKVARDLGVSDPLVGEVREGVQNANGSHSEHLPIERAKRVILESPQLSISRVADKADVSRATVSNARKELKAAGEYPESNPPKPTTPKPVAPGKTVKKRSDIKGARKAIHELLDHFELDTLKKAAIQELNL